MRLLPSLIVAAAALAVHAYNAAETGRTIAFGFLVDLNPALAGDLPAQGRETVRVLLLAATVLLVAGVALELYRRKR